MNSVSGVYLYIYIFNLGIDKGEKNIHDIFRKINIHLLIYLFRERRSRPHVSTMAPAGRTQDPFIHSFCKEIDCVISICFCVKPI